ncbi:PAS domain S-box-containing protein/diguanylate cyclase (GGDEF) domain-containing protein [Fontimonas thermophila]|uniref:cyclic-guanylate-specific phosphodiesterase n=1 Tax=Fontimonas thermophila TaxID=1076937 RepID=A0A1I2H0D9_9GAMM|nr:EAL domain-containing protein [Fontimonas thermophila]SFF22880.1 PAS domain S-box-containing protein/diguanylate cyclase (GGDEF) domain-containing protein [Fontimonas thermophila]
MTAAVAVADGPRAHSGSAVPGPDLRRWAHPATDRRGVLLRVAVLALAYCASGWAGLQLALPPGYATPIWPPSGLMMALLLLWGVRVWPGVWIGSFAVNLWVGYAQAIGPEQTIALVAAAIACGSTAEGLLGALLLRRFVAAPTLLDTAADIGRFFLLGGLLASTVAASISALALVAAGALAAADLAGHWLTWWVGDAMGVFLIAPLLLVAARVPDAATHGRLRAVALTVALALAVGSLVIQQTNRVESDRIAKEFTHTAADIDSDLETMLAEAGGAVYTLADFFEASTYVEEAQFARFADGLLRRSPGLRFLAWVARVPAASRAQHEREAQQQGLAGYRIRSAAGAPLGADQAYLPLRDLWPAVSGADLRGVDLGAEPQYRSLLEAAWAAGQLRASARLALIGKLGDGVVIAVPVKAPQGEGFAVGAIVVEQLMAHLLERYDRHGLAFSLTEPAAPPDAHLLYESGKAADSTLAWSGAHAFGGRIWAFRIEATPAYLRAHRSTEAWATQVGVLLFSALLGGFLLVLTGKAARVEQLVAMRTAQLHEKNRALAAELEIRARNEQRLRLAAAVFDHIGEATMITDADDRIVSVNRAFTEITGYREDEVRGRNPRALACGRHDPALYADIREQLREKGIWRGEIWGRRKNGEHYPQWLSIAAVRDAAGKVTHHVAVFSDISERKAAEERMLFLAQVDALTNLPNRYLLADRLQQAIELAQRSGQGCALMFVDIDRFKNINDSLGHSVGDALLREIAERLRRTVRATDTVARHGGDEFVIVMPAMTHAEELAHLADRILVAVAQPVAIEQHVLTPTASIGIACCPADGTDAENLMKHADAAMYAAKSAGRNAYRFFTPEMNTRVQQFLRIENELRRALAHGELVLHYQPQFDAFTGAVIGVEALVRWRHPQRGLILPGEFIPVAEESGLIQAIGEWVVDEACRQTRAWHDRGLRRVPVAVNLSAAELHRADTAGRIAGALQRNGLAARWLELEITESALMRDIGRARLTLQVLHDMGVQIALDDFGTGYSSLAHLRQFSLSALKLDRSFVRDLETDVNDAAICRAVIALGHTLGLRVIAEGVETTGQLVFLRGNRCSAIQGALFSPALPPEQVAVLLQPDYVAPVAPTLPVPLF